MPQHQASYTDTALAAAPAIVPAHDVQVVERSRERWTGSLLAVGALAALAAVLLFGPTVTALFGRFGVG